MDKKYYIAMIGEEELTTEDIVSGIISGIVTFAELQKTNEFSRVKQRNVKAHFIAKLDDLSAEQIVGGIIGGIATIADLQRTGEFGSEKQKKVKTLLKKKDDDVFAAATTITALENYLLVFPAGIHEHEAREKIQRQKGDDSTFSNAVVTNTLAALQDYLLAYPEGNYVDEARKKIKQIMYETIKADINEYTPDEITSKLSRDDLDDLCQELGLDARMIRNYTTPPLKYNIIPESKNDIPVGYTDVFFWGIRSSGKTCALSAILSTMKKDYLVEAPDCEKKFGATYRDSLTNIFRERYGYLPGRTGIDRTQYMPFLFYRKGEKRKRRISFFELSGEVFQYFYEEANSIQLIDEDARDDIQKSFKTLELLLNSDNKKIHFFFIDYNQETKHTADINGLTQSNYLEAAATYFRDKNDILKKKTDAVYVVVTKSDEIQIKENISDDKRNKARAAIAKSFLEDNFGSFIGVLQNLCEKHTVAFNVRQFSIGDVYFKQICKINRAYSTNIIEELLKWVKPESSIIKKILNS